ncbi:MAG: hypothetical protein RRZ24_00490 [Clostridia bacterium]
MEEVYVEDFICSEKIAPKRKFIRSDGALYAVLLIAVIGIIVAGNTLSVVWMLPRFYVQLTLYIILLGMGYLVYRFCLVIYGYTLTNRMLVVDRIIGKKVRSDENVHLSDIVSIRPLEKADGELGKCRALYLGRRREALAVTVCTRGRRYTILISPSEAFAGKLIKQWKIERK